MKIKNILSAGVISVASLLSISSAFAFDQWPKGTIEVECIEIRWQHGAPGGLVATFTDHASHKAQYTGALRSGHGGDESLGQAILIEACSKADQQGLGLILGGGPIGGPVVTDPTKPPKTPTDTLVGKPGTKSFSLGSGDHWRPTLLISVDPATILYPIPSIIAIDWQSL